MQIDAAVPFRSVYQILICVCVCVYVRRFGGSVDLGFIAGGVNAYVFHHLPAIIVWCSIRWIPESDYFLPPWNCAETCTCCKTRLIAATK